MDSNIRTNRVTEMRLSRDMVRRGIVLSTLLIFFLQDEHHQHCHNPHQSMPLSIRGFHLEGTALTVPDDATIRPLSNVNYRGSERVKNHRIYPWSNLHGGGTSSRTSTLVPIVEFQNSSFDKNHLIDMPGLVLEE